MRVCLPQKALLHWSKFTKIFLTCNNLSLQRKSWTRQENFSWHLANDIGIDEIITWLFLAPAKALTHLARICRDGSSHDSLQVATQTHSLHRDEGLLCQYRPAEINRVSTTGTLIPVQSLRDISRRVDQDSTKAQFRRVLYLAEHHETFIQAYMTRMENIEGLTSLGRLGAACIWASHQLKPCL